MKEEPYFKLESRNLYRIHVVITSEKRWYQWGKPEERDEPRNVFLKYFPAGDKPPSLDVCVIDAAKVADQGLVGRAAGGATTNHMQRLPIEDIEGADKSRKDYSRDNLVKRLTDQNVPVGYIWQAFESQKSELKKSDKEVIKALAADICILLGKSTGDYEPTNEIKKILNPNYVPAPMPGEGVPNPLYVEKPRAASSAVNVQPQVPVSVAPKPQVPLAPAPPASVVGQSDSANVRVVAPAQVPPPAGASPNVPLAPTGDCTGAT